MKTNTITVRVGPDVAKRLRKLATATRRSRSYLAAEAIEEYLTVQEWQVQAIQEGNKAIEKDEGVDLEDVRKTWEKKLADSSD